jgi:hypothetical protein
MIRYCHHNGLPMKRILSQLCPVHTLISCLFQINYNMLPNVLWCYRHFACVQGCLWHVLAILLAELPGSKIYSCWAAHDCASRLLAPAFHSRNSIEIIFPRNVRPVFLTAIYVWHVVKAECLSLYFFKFYFNLYMSISSFIWGSLPVVHFPAVTFA